jgi:hypothetical protein
VEVTIDDGRSPAPLGGDAVAVDPGEHWFRFATAGHRAAERVLVVAAGVKDRHERVVLASVPEADRVAPPLPPRALPPPAPHKSSSGVMVPVVALGGAALLGVGIGIGAGVAATSKHQALSVECPGNVCPPTAQDDLDGFRALRLASTIAYAVGVGAAFAATVVWLIGSAHTHASAGRARLSLNPGGVELEGSF